MINVRKAVLSDAEVIAENNVLLARESEGEQLSFDMVLDGVKSVLLDDNKGFYLVAEQKNSIVGQLMITFEWSDWRNQMIWWLQSVYVKKPYRDSGVFTCLLQEIKKQAKHQNVSILRLYVFNQNEEAIKVYRKQGWKKGLYMVFQKDISTI